MAYGGGGRVNCSKYCPSTPYEKTKKDFYIIQYAEYTWTMDDIGHNELA